MPLLEVEHLHAHYDYAPVLQGVSFTVDAGQIVSIFGRNGAGKTTALRAIMGWLQPSQGRVALLGREHRGAVARSHLPARHCLHPRGSPHLPDAQRRGESDARPVQPVGHAGGRAPSPSRTGRRIVPTPGRAPPPAREDLVRRRAADARDRTRLDRRAEAAADRRTVGRPRAHHRQRDLRFACAACAAKASRCSWSSRTYGAPPPSAISAMSWRKGGLSCTVRRRW